MIQEEQGVHVRFTHSGIVTPRRALRHYTEKLLARCLRDKNYADASVNVLYCSVRMIQDLNQRHRGINKPTDVLSFPSSTDPAELRGYQGAHLGDLAISLQICNNQAPEHDRPTEDEVALLLVHGFLHLLGYDHDTPQREREMWAETDRLLELAADLKRPKVDAKRP